MRIIITLYLLTNSLFSFDYHLKPYTMAENVVCFFGLGAEANQNNGGNIVNSCYAELKDGYVVIDSGPTYSYAQQAYQIMQKRKRLPVKYVINTSTDDTHILGNSFYKEQGATLLGPKSYDEFKEIKIDQKISSDAFMNTRVIPLDRKITKNTKIKCCTMRMDINKIMKKNDNYLTVYLPDRKLILAGDMIYNNRIPQLKKDRSLLRWIDAINKIEKSSWDTIISAHGVKTKRNAIKSTKNYLLELRDGVIKSLKKRKTKEETVNNLKMVSFKDEKLYNELHRKNVENAYDELSKIKIEKLMAIFVAKKLADKKKKKRKSPKNVKKKEQPKKKKVIKKIKRVPKIRYYSYRTALNLARKYKKILLIKIRSDNCSYCNELDRVMSRNSKIRKIINKNYMVVYLNNSRDKLPLGIEVGLTPSLVFVRPDKRKVVMTINGIRAIGELVDVLNEGVRDAITHGYLK